eukprot:m.174277 g.174277  ORF g.174277 m.174277 type:complete len:183 (-) comp13810_c0_seq1:194-742(-)
MVVAVLAALVVAQAACGPHDPPVWPDRLMLVQRKVVDPGAEGGPNVNATVVTYYDSSRGANLLIVAPDGNTSDALHDLELNSGHSYYYTPARRTCMPLNFSVGILRPNWLANATFLGERRVNGRVTLAWTKANFIDYYADPGTCEPVSWYFHAMKATFYTVLYEPGTEVPDTSWFKPPAYCP